MKRVLALALAIIMVFSFVACVDNKSENETEMPPKVIKLTSNEFVGKDYFDVWELLEENGFTNIDYEAIDCLTSAEEEKDDTVQSVTINGEETYEVGSTYMSNVEIKIYYNNIKTVYAPFASDERPEDELYGGIKKLFKDEGFTNIKLKPIEDLIFGWLTEDGEVESVTIDGDDTFDDFTSYNFDAEVVIKYHTFPQDDEETEESKSEATNEEDLKEPSNPSPVFYSTNDYETAKNGNTGVFSYKNKSGSYDIYWIIDFDDGYVYFFTDGNGDISCDKVKIVGNLNNRITATWHEGGDQWSWYLHFKYKNAPETLVIIDHNGFSNEFTTTNLERALRVRDTKTIKEY